MAPPEPILYAKPKLQSSLTIHFVAINGTSSMFPFVLRTKIDHQTSSKQDSREPDIGSTIDISDSMGSGVVYMSPEYALGRLSQLEQKKLVA